ncbi:enoyl-CoA hydratase [Fictibacillus sp. S7]|uniref:enoyl-CoA hydratase n=1 Tax=Fictibacillus sp. S7 TaxID=2212476 RepID=UPI0010107D23|nr:enoyl-CoA hydratase [Fictibacillus sp. S7]RXZ01429.1 enoyl-CoA hydratase [Fictibacillus sp. S7]
MVRTKAISCHKEAGIAILMIDNPPLNVLDRHVVSELSAWAEELENDKSIVAVIITGKGDKAFMAGADIKEFPEWMGKGEELPKQKSRELQRAFHQIYELNKPTIAALNGVALGGGCELALACDLRIAEEHVLIGLPEIKLGLFPGAGGTQRLPRLIGETKAKGLMYTGQPITAQEAEKIGLLNYVVEKGKSVEKAKEIAMKLTELSLPVLSYIKKSVHEGCNGSLEEGLHVEAKYFGEVFQTHDVVEGVQAFIQKRKPDFKHK